MASIQRNPLQMVKEARQIARDYDMRLVECTTATGIDYVVYRKLPDGSEKRLGKRSSPERIRAYVAYCAADYNPKGRAQSRSAR